MLPLTISRPDSNTQLALYRVESVMPLIQRYFRQSPPLSEVVEATGDFLRDAGNCYGCQYVSLVPVEPDGMAYLPAHVKRVLSVSRAPAGISELNAAVWTPACPLPSGREWVADQIMGAYCWRSSWLDDLVAWPGQQLETYQRTTDGVYLPQYRRVNLRVATPCVVVVYDAQLTDERGYPLLGTHDAPAAAHYWNWQRLQAEAYGGSQQALSLLALATDSMNRTMGQARIGEGISDEGWNYILRMATSWDRASFGYGLQLPAPGQLPSERARSYVAS